VRCHHCVTHCPAPLGPKSLGGTGSLRARVVRFKVPLATGCNTSLVDVGKEGRLREIR
jgi:hypothetical protein